MKIKENLGLVYVLLGLCCVLFAVVFCEGARLLPLVVAVPYFLVGSSLLVVRHLKRK
jgi:hypothetical protein